MSVRVISWVWEHSRAEGTDRLVLLAIADCASDDGGNAWPSVATIAEKAKVSERTVQRAVKALVLLGELAVELNGGRRGCNAYTVRMSPRQSVTPDNVTPVRTSPRQRDRATPVTLRGDTRDTRTVLNRPTTPLTPRMAGGIPADCCEKHSKYRNNCRTKPSCQEVRAARIAAEREDELARSRALLEERAEARRNKAPRPKEASA